jgi:hypothetical protein
MRAATQRGAYVPMAPSCGSFATTPASRDPPILKVLDPDGRLEKRPWSGNRWMSQKCRKEKSLVVHGLLVNGVWAGGSLRLSTLKKQPQMLFSEVTDRANQEECQYNLSLHPRCRE